MLEAVVLLRRQLIAHIAIDQLILNHENRFGESVIIKTVPFETLSLNVRKLSKKVPTYFFLISQLRPYLKCHTR
jgi:hypothetical protein